MALYRRTSRKSSVLIPLIAFLALPAFLHAQQDAFLSLPIRFGEHDSKTCLRCHGMEHFFDRDAATLRVRDFSVPPEAFGASAHSALECRQCHADIAEYPHATRLRKVSCGDDCHATDARGAPYSHRKEYDEFAASVHGRSLVDPASDAPTCLGCHGEGRPHAIAKASNSLTAAQKIDACARCHDNRALMVKNRVNPEAVPSYRRSFHFKAIKFDPNGDGRDAAVCQDCHTVHGVLPKDSTRSSIAPANIARTCGQERCHKGAQPNFAMSGANHLNLRIEHEPLMQWIETLFYVLTGGTMLMLVIGILLDIQRKYGWLAVARASLARASRAAGLTRYAVAGFLRRQFAREVKG